MTEKRVSVRLSAEGGRQVRAELEGIGEAGTRGFRRLSTEMEVANARLAAFARQARIAVAAATAALAAAAGAAIRSALATVDAQAKLAASLNTTVESVQVLARAGELAGVSMGEIERATVQLTRRLSEAAGGTGPAVQALRRLGLTARELQALPLDQRLALIQDRLRELVPAAERAAVASDLFGDRTALALLRIDTATLRQATQDVRDFGVAVSDQDARQIERTNDAISRLGLVWRGFANQLAVVAAPALEAVANALAAVARATQPVARGLEFVFDNLGRLATYAATFAAFMGRQWVAAFAAAALSVRWLSAAFNVLRFAIIRTGIGILIVAIGEAVYQITRFVEAVGGLGNAFRLLRDLAGEVWERIGLAANVAMLRMSAGWETLKARGFDAFDAIVDRAVNAGNRFAGIFQGAYDATVAIWGRLPGAIGDFAFQAANSLIAGVESMLNGIVERINRFIEDVNSLRDYLPEFLRADWLQLGTLNPIRFGRIPNPFAGLAAAAGEAAAAAFNAALQRTYIRPPETDYRALADSARGRANELSEAADRLAESVRRPLAFWQALQEAVARTRAESEPALAGAADAAGLLSDNLDAAAEAAGRAGASGRQAGEESAAGANLAAEAWLAAAQRLAEFAQQASNTASQMADFLIRGMQRLEDSLINAFRKGKLEAREFFAFIAEELARLAIRRFIIAPLSDWLSGLFGRTTTVRAAQLHSGGIVGIGGAVRAVDPRVFYGAPRLHRGGWAGLKPDEVPAILQRGERVLSRREAARFGSTGPAVITVNVSGANGDRQIFEMVRAGVSEVLREYDASLPVRFRQISAGPRKRGWA